MPASTLSLLTGLKLSYRIRRVKSWIRSFSFFSNFFLASLKPSKLRTFGENLLMQLFEDL